MRSRQASILIYYLVMVIGISVWFAGIVVEQFWIEFGGLTIAVLNSFMPDFSTGKPLAWRKFGWIWFYTGFVLPEQESGSE